MTRINVVPVQDLHYRHLVAEYHELPRIFQYVRNAQAINKHPGDFKIPPDYVLGKGHCTFFYDKLGWLKERFASLVAEMQRRGYKTNHSADDVLDGIDPEWIGDWEPTSVAFDLNTNRINERLAQMKSAKGL